MESIPPASLWSILVFIAWAWPISLIVTGTAIFLICRKASGQEAYDRASRNDARVIGELVSIKDEAAKHYVDVIDEWKTLARASGHKTPAASPPPNKTAAPSASTNGQGKRDDEDFELVIPPDRIPNGGRT